MRGFNVSVSLLDLRSSIGLYIFPFSAHSQGLSQHVWKWSIVFSFLAMFLTLILRLKSFFLDHLLTLKKTLSRYFVTPTLRTVSPPARCPSGTWDSHMHVIEPDKFPLAVGAIYNPPTHTLPQAKSFEAGLGIRNIVLVQPSIYGFDNACLISALKEMGPERGRGVVVFDPHHIEKQTLKEWHEIGVRGVRLNIKSVGRKISERELEQVLHLYADLIRPFGWVVQVYIDLKLVSLLERIVPNLDVKFCIDHFGSPDLPKSPDSSRLDPYTLPGFESLVSLLRQGNTWVKVSAPYRLSNDPQMRDLEAFTKELLRVANSRLVYATDWPHTRYSGIDIKPFVSACLSWCRTNEVADKLFRRNAEELWSVNR